MLGEAYLYANLGVGDVIYLIAAVQINTLSHLVANPRRSANRYSEDRTRRVPLPSGKYELKVDLRAGDHGEYAESYWYEVRVWENVEIIRLNQRPASIG